MYQNGMCFEIFRPKFYERVCILAASNRRVCISGCDSKIFSLSVAQGALLLIDGPFSSSQLPLKFL